MEQGDAIARISTDPKRRTVAEVFRLSCLGARSRDPAPPVRTPRAVNCDRNVRREVGTKEIVLRTNATGQAMTAPVFWCHGRNRAAARLHPGERARSRAAGKRGDPRALRPPRKRASARKPHPRAAREPGRRRTSRSATTSSGVYDLASGLNFNRGYINLTGPSRGSAALLRGRRRLRGRPPRRHPRGDPGRLPRSAEGRAHAMRDSADRGASRPASSSPSRSRSWRSRPTSSSTSTRATAPRATSTRPRARRPRRARSASRSSSRCRPASPARSTRRRSCRGTTSRRPSAAWTARTCGASWTDSPSSSAR